MFKLAQEIIQPKKLTGPERQNKFLKDFANIYEKHKTSIQAGNVPREALPYFTGFIESKGDPYAINKGTGAAGTYQIMDFNREDIPLKDFLDSDEQQTKYFNKVNDYIYGINKWDKNAPTLDGEKNHAQYITNYYGKRNQEYIDEFNDLRKNGPQNAQHPKLKDQFKLIVGEYTPHFTSEGSAFSTPKPIGLQTTPTRQDNTFVKQQPPPVNNVNPFERKGYGQSGGLKGVSK